MAAGERGGVRLNLNLRFLSHEIIRKCFIKFELDEDLQRISTSAKFHNVVEG